MISKQVGTFYSFDGTPIYYEIRGEGEPLVLVYGIACLINHWHHQIEYFSKHYKVIAFDMRGHHKSSPINDPNNINLNAVCTDIHLLLKHLNIKSAHFMGHSFGAPVILQFFHLYPKEVKSMVFINGFSKNPIKGMFGLDVVEKIFHFVKAGYDSQPDVWRALWKMAVDNPVAMFAAALAGGFNLKVVHFKDIEVYVRGVARMDLDVFLKLFEQLMEFNGDIILPTINVPTLVVSGEKDNVTPQRFQHAFKDAIPHSEFLLVPYGSHCTQLDFPDYINLKMEKFLESTKK